MNLGREDQLDRDGLRRLVALDQPLPRRRRPAPATRAAVVADQLRVTRVASDGRGVAAGRAVAPARRRHRAAQGAGTRAGSPPTWSGCCSRWWRTGPSTRGPSSPPRSGRPATSPSPGWTAMDDDQAYRAMDLLVEADADGEGAGGGVLRGGRPAQPRGRPAVLRHHQHLLRTRHRDDADGEDGRVPPLRALQGPPRGPAADRDRPGGHQGRHPGAVLVLAGQHQRRDGPARGQGRPARLAARPGGHRGRPRVLLRRQPGLPAPRRRALHRRGTDARRHAGDAARRCPGRAATRVARQPAGQGSPARRHPGSPVDHLPQPRRGRTDKTTRDDAIARLESRAGPDQRRPSQGQRTRARRPAASRPRPAGSRAAGTRAAECALRDHPTLGRWLRQTSSGRLVARPGQDRRRGQARRQVPALHLRPAT